MTKNELRSILVEFLTAPEGKGRRRAKDKAVEAYDFLVIQTFKKNFSNLPDDISIDDMYQIGRKTLSDCLDKYDPTIESAAAFDTYAIIAILREMRNYVVRDASWCQYGRSNEWKHNSVINELTLRLGREPESQEIAKELGLTRESYSEFLRSIEANRPFSVDYVIESEGSEETTLGDMLDSGVDIHKMLVLKEQASIIKELAGSLPDVLYNVACYMFEGYKVKDIADEMDISIKEATTYVNAVRRRLRLSLSKGTNREMFSEWFDSIDEKKKKRKSNTA